jgi:guanine nucleotide-binding protein alpha-1 subunit
MLAKAARISADDNDPLAIRPPPYESTEERNERLRMEKAAKATSDNIDADLERLVMSEKRGPKPIKILLLGASFDEIFRYFCNL